MIALGGGALASGVGQVAKSIAPAADHRTAGWRTGDGPVLAQRGGGGNRDHRHDRRLAAGRCPIPEVLDDLLVLVDDVMLVEDDAIKTGMRLLLQHAGVVVEPSAALGIAAVLENRERFAGRRVATILCGSNVTTDDFARWALGDG